MNESCDRLLTAQQAADFLRLKLATVRQLTYSRELPVVRPTGWRAVRYRLRDLLRVSEVEKVEIQQAAPRKGMIVSAHLFHLYEWEMKRLK